MASERFRKSLRPWFCSAAFLAPALAVVTCPAQSEYVRPPSRSMMVADFERGVLNNQAGLIVAHGEAPSDGQRGRVLMGRGDVTSGVESISFDINNGGWAAWWTFLKPDQSGVDIGWYEELRFWMRGRHGGEPLTVVFTDVNGREASLNVSRVMPIPMDQDWWLVRMPLRLFDLKQIDSRLVKTVSLRPARRGATSVYIDDLELVAPGETEPWIPTGFSRLLDDKPRPGSKPTPYGWLLSRLGTCGFLASADDDTYNAYAYDQALGIIAFTAGGNHVEARRVLTALTKVQNNDGSFASCFHAGTCEVIDPTRYSGNNAWIVMAINFYTKRTGDRRYLKMATRCADWLLQQQDARSGGMRGGPGVKWFSTEHNADAFSALYHLGRLTKDQRYTKAAFRVRDFIAACLYAPSELSGGRDKDRPVFWTGWKSTTAIGTDPQTWTALALAPAGYDRRQLKDAMKWLLDSKCRVQADYDTDLAGIDGFDWDEFLQFPDLPATAARESRYPSQNVWFEGTEGAVAAFRVLGMDRQANHFHEETGRVKARSGGIPYSTPHPDLFRRSTPELAVASTAWYVFNEQRINPFDPGP